LKGSNLINDLTPENRDDIPYIEQFYFFKNVKKIMVIIPNYGAKQVYKLEIWIDIISHHIHTKLRSETNL